MAKKKPKSKSTKQSSGPKIPAVADNDVDNVIAAALCTAPPPVLMKVCRLCETKDGPFLNIFDADKVTARKIDDLMPFAIAENDDLPHKICFRCSAKVEELHEFIQKCIKTQENLRSMMGKEGTLTMKSRTRVLWEQQLHKTKLSNDDICDVLIKRAMEGIPLNAPLDEIEEEKQAPVTRQPKEQPVAALKDSSSDAETDDDDDDYGADVSLKEVKMSIEKKEEEAPTKRPSRSVTKVKPEAIKEVEESVPKNKKVKTYSRVSQNKLSTTETKEPEPEKAKASEQAVESKKEPVVEKPKEIPPSKPEVTAPPFNIMDHVCTIKVNKVGILFQCKLCNRNFLRKDIVLTHGCAKNNAPPKETTTTNAPIPGPPKPPTVKYIKMDKDFKRPLSSLIDKTVEPPPKPVEPEVKPVEPAKPKPKSRAGPASRVKPRPATPPETPKEPPPPPKATTPIITSNPPSVSFPVTPSLSSRYKLVPGPNNTFQLVEETAGSEQPVEQKPEDKPQPKSKKRKANELSSNKSSSATKKEKSPSPEVIDLEENVSPKAEPYPVGLFQPVPHHSSVYPPSHPPVPFTTPAMKKQSYTIVQTGNPSKLLISTKPQPVSEEPAKKKSKKKSESKEKEPFKVSLEETAPPKDSGFFTFVSLDPLLQPSYVLPTDNIIQESQISTSTPGAKSVVDKDKEKYPCNMCGETFTREKKLLAHIQSHYNQMDEEDEQRAGKPGPKRRTRKS